MGLDDKRPCRNCAMKRISPWHSQAYGAPDIGDFRRSLDFFKSRRSQNFEMR